MNGYSFETGILHFKHGTVIFRTSLSIVLGVWLQMGVIGVAIAMVSDWTLKAILLVLRYRSGKWTQYKLI